MEGDRQAAGSGPADAVAAGIRLSPIGFWSYSRQDDELSKGKLSNLRALLMSEIQQQYGRDRVQLFQDVSAIPHGAEWEREIRNSLANSTFFIPIITPNFLQSEWCCREVMVFLEREAQLFEVYPDLPRRRRIFPLQLIDIAGIEASDGRVPEVLEKLQWFDFRDLRHSSFDNESVHRALSKFAASIRDLLQVKVRPPRTAEEIEREAAAAAARAREEEAAIALRRAQEEEHREREAEEARASEALRAAEREARAEAELQAQAAPIEAHGAAEGERSANADADWADWNPVDEIGAAPGEGGLLGWWRAAPAARRIASGAAMLSILVIGILALLRLGGREETSPAPEMSSEPPLAVEDAGPPTRSEPLPEEAAPVSTPPTRPAPLPAEAAPASTAPLQAEPAPLGPAPGGPAVRARLIGGAISSDDYPVAALRAESEGSTGIRFAINAAGRVTQCSVRSSSGDAALDEATCRIVRTRFRFAPARNARGRPTSDNGSMRITWRLPAE